MLLFLRVQAPKATWNSSLIERRAAAGRGQSFARLRPVANINPHLHYPVVRELARQVSLGAVALKIHPVHGGFEARDRMLYPAYAWAQDRQLPVQIVHCGTSTFSGSANAYADPVLLDDVFRDFPDLAVVLAHGGRGLVQATRPPSWP